MSVPHTEEVSRPRRRARIAGVWQSTSTRCITTGTLAPLHGRAPSHADRPIDRPFQSTLQTAACATEPQMASPSVGMCVCASDTENPRPMLSRTQLPQYRVYM